jgi:hypothetical protein
MLSASGSIASGGNRVAWWSCGEAAGMTAQLFQVTEKPLRASGRIVHASDIHDYGLPGCHIVDYLSAPTPPTGWADGIITNPPYGRAQEFAAKAISEVPYVALLVRTNFLMDGEERGHWLDRNPPTRTWYLLPRLPMMHRHGWEGAKSTSNTPHAWVVWEAGEAPTLPRRAYWRELLNCSAGAASGSP